MVRHYQLLAPESRKARLEVLRSRMLMFLDATWQPDCPLWQFLAHSQEEGREEVLVSDLRQCDLVTDPRVAVGE